jgi:hypothetical protein
MGWGIGLDSSGSVLRPVAGCCELGDERSDYIKCWEFTAWLATTGLSRRTRLHFLILRPVHITRARARVTRYARE